MAFENLEAVKKYLEDNVEAEEAKAFVASIKPVDVAKLTEADFEAWKATDDGKRAIERDRDRAVTRGIETWKEKHLQQMIDEKVRELHPEPTPVEKENRELLQRLERLERERSREQMANATIRTLNERKLPIDLVDLFAAETEEQMRTRIDMFTDHFTAAVDAAVEERLKSSAREPVRLGQAASPVVNPFMPGPGFNMTKQGELLRADPEKAELLRKAAETSGKINR